jgi:4'-phosphopantetheinyl transferase
VLKTAPPPLALASSISVDAGSASAVLQAEGVELWVLRMADVDAAKLDRSLLDAQERRRLDRLTRPDDRWRYVGAHLLLRQLLSRHLACTPREVTYRRDPCPRCGAPNGRPAVDGATQPLHFSLSHSAGIVLIGIASAPIGVDVEALASEEASSEVSALLHPAERSEIFSAVPAMRSEVFARLWTRKEAYLKGLGTGIAHDLASDYLGTERRAAAPPGWTVVSLSAPQGYAAAAAVASPLGR